MVFRAARREVTERLADPIAAFESSPDLRALRFPLGAPEPGQGSCPAATLMSLVIMKRCRASVGDGMKPKCR
jgi:hypothetical protein